MIHSFIAFIYWVAAAIIYGWIFLNEFSHYACDMASSGYNTPNPEYDYIVVGSGSAGSIVASRLAEDLNASVLVIEAGGSAPSWACGIPIISPLLQLTVQDWQFQTTEQQHACFGLIANISRWPRGKVVGGTSRLNYMLYLRGHLQDYIWLEEGNKYWSDPKDYLQYFKKSEKQRGRYRKNFYHSESGDMDVSDLQHTTPLADAFLTAAQELGYPVRDLNGEAQTGFMEPQVNMRHGKRWSAEHGILSEQKNLKIFSNAVVTKVLFQANFEAYGVEGVQLEQTFRITARRAVILSAGVIGSPKILMHSGIGPKDHLVSLGIPVIRDLPVGKNLQDHITTGLDLVLLNQSLSLGLFDVASPSSAWEYFWNGKGPWTAAGCEATGIVYSRLADPARDPPDLQIVAVPMGLSSDYGGHMKTAMGIKEQVWSEYFSPLRGQNVASLMPVLLHPKSYGEVKLRSNRVEDAPLINPNYLSEEDDLNVLYEEFLVSAPLSL